MHPGLYFSVGLFVTAALWTFGSLVNAYWLWVKGNSENYITDDIVFQFVIIFFVALAAGLLLWPVVLLGLFWAIPGVPIFLWFRRRYLKQAATEA